MKTKDLNKHILLVIKWLNDKNSVTQDELVDSRKDASAAAAASYADAVDAADAADAADADAADTAEKRVNKYFERTGKNKQDYIDALSFESIPVYTAAMCDAGELPSVGMECLFKKRGALESGTVTAITKRFIIFTDWFGDEHVRKIDELTIEPLTPPIKLIDGKAYQFKAHKNRKPVDGFYSAYKDEFVYLQGTVRSNDAINIKLLEVKS